MGHEVNWKVPKEPVLALTHQNGDACVEHLEATWLDFGCSAPTEDSLSP